mgnify:CR=1 FL=1
MRKFLKYALILVPALFVLSACSIHEWPESEPADVTVVLDLDLSGFGEYKTIEYDTRAGSREGWLARYTIKAYRLMPDGSPEQTPRYSQTFLRGRQFEKQVEFKLSIPEGRYLFAVWADFSGADGTGAFYDIDDFSDIRLDCSERGCTDYKDAFRGTAEASVARGKSGERTVVPVGLERPLAKVRFISTDLEDFITKVMEARKTEVGSPEAADIDFSAYRVYLRYTGYLPSAYNIFTAKPFDASTGVSLTSEITPSGDNEALLGFDYVLTNGAEASVMMAVELQGIDGETLSRSGSIEVPLKRAHLTTVRGRFLTQEVGGGIGVDPGFEGNFDIRID